MYLAARVERWPFHVWNPCDVRSGSLQNAPNFLGDPTMTLLTGLHLKQPLRAYSTNQIKHRRPEQRSIEASNACINFLFLLDSFTLIFPSYQPKKTMSEHRGRVLLAYSGGLG